MSCKKEIITTQTQEYGKCKNSTDSHEFSPIFIWGSWLCTLGLYMTTPVEDGGLAFDGALVGSVFALSGIASLIMPALIGVVSDKWVNAERLMGVLHWVGAISLFVQRSLPIMICSK